MMFSASLVHTETAGTVQSLLFPAAVHSQVVRRSEMTAPPGHLALVAVGLANLIALISGGLQPPFEPGFPPCALQAVCPPAWLPPDPDSCPPCPELEAAPCPVVQPVCPVVESSKPEPEVDPWGWVAAAAPGVTVALLGELRRLVHHCQRRSRTEEDDRSTSPAPARRGGGVVR